MNFISYSRMCKRFEISRNSIIINFNRSKWRDETENRKNSSPRPSTIELRKSFTLK